MCTRNFTMPMYTTKNRKGEIVSLSDHEALDAEFLIERRNTPYHYLKNSQPKNDNFYESPSLYPVPKSSSNKKLNISNKKNNLNNYHYVNYTILSHLLYMYPQGPGYVYSHFI